MISKNYNKEIEIYLMIVTKGCRDKFLKDLNKRYVTESYRLSTVNIQYI